MTKKSWTEVVGAPQHLSMEIIDVATKQPSREEVEKDLREKNRTATAIYGFGDYDEDDIEIIFSAGYKIARLARLSNCHLHYYRDSDVDVIDSTEGTFLTLGHEYIDRDDLTGKYYLADDAIKIEDDADEDDNQKVYLLKWCWPTDDAILDYLADDEEERAELLEECGGQPGSIDMERYRDLFDWDTPVIVDKGRQINGHGRIF